MLITPSFSQSPTGKTEMKMRGILAGFTRVGPEADAERMDWLEAHKMTVRLDYDGACRLPWSVYYEQADVDYLDLRGEGDTLREAIDAARSLATKPDA